jgi:xylan 1,4-beta-xylosidase
MRPCSRREAFKAALAGAVASRLPGTEATAAPRGPRPDRREFGAGVEGQRRADLGDGTYRNPIVPGDHPDPTILKDGADYYMTFSSFLSYPGVVLWHSRDRRSPNPSVTSGPWIWSSTRGATTSTSRRSATTAAPST